MKNKFQVGDYVLVKSGKYRGRHGEVRGFQSGLRFDKKYYEEHKQDNGEITAISGFATPRIKNRSIYNVFLEDSDGRYEDRDFYSYELEIIYQNGTWGLQYKDKKTLWERKIEHVDLVFENCESARLEPDMFYGLAIRGIKKNYNINCAQYKNGEYWENTTCEKFYITINEKGLKEAKFNDPQFDKNEILKTQLDKWRDITHVHIYFEGKNDEYISVPWKGEKDSRYNMTNECQFHERIKNTENDSINLAIEIKE